MNRITKIVIALILISILMFFRHKLEESFTNLAKYPLSQEVPLLAGDYPLIGRNEVTNNNANDIWWHEPIFTEGSYAQITNNIRYSNNPDNGSCTPAEFCGSLYKNKKHKPNAIVPLPPVPSSPGMRINYYRSNSEHMLGDGLMVSLPALP